MKLNLVLTIFLISLVKIDNLQGTEVNNLETQDSRLVLTTVLLKDLKKLEILIEDMSKCLTSFKQGSGSRLPFVWKICSIPIHKIGDLWKVDLETKTETYEIDENIVNTIRNWTGNYIRLLFVAQEHGVQY